MERTERKRKSRELNGQRIRNFGHRFVVERNNDNKKRNLKPARLVSGISNGLTPISGRIKFTAGQNYPSCHDKDMEICRKRV